MNTMRKIKLAVALLALTVTVSAQNSFELRKPSNNTVQGVITDAGKLGVGTQSPSYTLHVAGDSYTSGQSIVGGTMTVTGSDFSIGGGTFTVVAGHIGINTASTANPLYVVGGELDAATTRFENGWSDRQVLLGATSAGVGDKYWGLNASQGLIIEDLSDALAVSYSYKFDAGGFGIGVNAATPILNTLDVEGGAAIGAGYSAAFTAPSNGMIVQGLTGIGTSAPVTTLDVNGSFQFGSGVTKSTGGTGGSITLASTANLATNQINGNGLGLLVSTATIFQSTLTVQGNAFSVAGTTLVVTGGKVGISSAAPVGLLSVGSPSNFGVTMGDWGISSAYSMLTLNGNIGTGANFYTSGGDLSVNRPTGGSLYFSENAVQQLAISPGGTAAFIGSTMTIATTGIITAPSQPGAFFYRSTNFSVPDVTYTDLNFNSGNYLNVGGMFTASVATVPAAGVYSILCGYVINANAIGIRDAVILVNGSAPAGFVGNENNPSATNATRVTATVISYPLAANDKVSCQAYQTSGGVLDISSAYFQIQKLW